ncbi:MAG: plasmid pRiA4b ORF-3 family protein [Demequinaceae bacterium]|nr:plasmid pRiA4b ORF-3 family protein [Demequinaceae bacterium]
MGESTGAGRQMVRIRAALQWVEPEVWRVLDVDAEMTLEELHRALQVAFGWRDYHLHAFAQELDLPKDVTVPADARGASSTRHGTSVEYGPMGERRLRKYWRDERSLAEGMTGIPEADAKVGEVFAESHPPVEYEYDFGDGWVHTLEWVDTCAGEPGESRATLVRAEGNTPWEDSGGPPGYAEMREAAGDPTHEDHLPAARWVHDLQGPWVWPHGTPPDVGLISRELARQFPDVDAAPRRPTAIDALIEIMVDGWVPEFRIYLDRAGVDLDVAVTDPAVDPSVIQAAVRPFAWLLHRVGPTGLKLTAAGWLPPAVVVDALAELGWQDREVGTGNRENQTNSVFDLRHTAMAVGLLRVQKGMLLLTPAGRKVADDALGLWRHLARAVVDRAKTDVERDAALLFAVELAAGRDSTWDHPRDRLRDPYGDAVADALQIVGWTSRSGEEIDAFTARDAGRLALDVFDILGAWERNSRTRRGAATEAGRAFARDILALPADLARHRSSSGR